MMPEIIEDIILGLVLAGCTVFIVGKIRRKLKIFGPNSSGCSDCCGCMAAGEGKSSCPPDGVKTNRI